MRTRALPIAPAEPVMLVGDEGAPVWPVWDLAIEERLSRLATTLGASLHHAGARAVPGRTAAPGSRAGEIVAALTPSAEPAARLYAHLTGRAFVAGALEAEPTPPSVLVGEFGAWDIGLVRRAAQATPSGMSPGLIMGRDPDELMRQVVLRSSALCMAGAPIARRIALLSNLPIEALEDGRDVILGGFASAETVLGWLARAAQEPTVVGLLGHSDGIDGKLSNDAVLCPLVEDEARYRGHHALQCRRDGACYRTGIAREVAQAAGRLVPPSALGGAVVIADACTVIPPPGNRIAPADSLGARIVEDAVSGAVLVNAEVSLGNVSRISALLVAIAAGRPLGEAVARFNAGGADRVTRRLLILGDPALRFEPQPGEGASADESRGPRSGAPRAPALLPTRAVAATGFARRMAERMGRALAPSGGAALRRWTAALDGLDGECGSAGAKRQLALAAAAQASAFALDPTIFPQEHWLGFAMLADAPDSPACFCCDEPMTATRASFAEGYEERVYAVCPNCMACLDAPAGARLALSLDDHGRPALQADLAGHPARARIFYHAPYSAGRRIWRPRLSDSVSDMLRHGPARPDNPWMVGGFVGFGLQHGFALATAHPPMWRAGESARRRRLADRVAGGGA